MPAQRCNVYLDDTWLGRSCFTVRWKVLGGFESVIDLICLNGFTLHIIVWRGARVETVNRLSLYP